MYAFLSHTGVVADATDLMSRFGDDAELQAAARAERSRNLGNQLHFCRWRQTERLIALLGCDEPVGSIH